MRLTPISLLRIDGPQSFGIKAFFFLVIGVKNVCNAACDTLLMRIILSYIAKFVV
jgi:hypothetical protein